MSSNSNVFYCTCQNLVWSSSKNAIIVEGGREGGSLEASKEGSKEGRKGRGKL
jgi:hypothetical protein